MVEPPLFPSSRNARIDLSLELEVVGKRLDSRLKLEREIENE